MSAKTLMVVGAVVLSCLACAAETTGITVIGGTWSYTVSEGIPLPGPPGPGPLSCVATGSGTTDVSGDGHYSITFPALACNGCTMTATTSGIVTSTSTNGTVSASITGTGCSGQQPTPNPATVNGRCTSTSCTAQTSEGTSFSVEYTLTPPP
jgi:hypothetical protein